jgi:cell division protein FtsZ
VQEETPMQLVVKEAPVQEVKIGEHVLSADELEEKRRFEDQKRALEERAERLRRMSFNVKGNDSSDEVESVPAYVRRNVNIDNGVASADTFYSGYSVGNNNPQQGNQASIQTINTFLDGKKPD